MIYYRPVRELLFESMKELKQFSIPFSFYEFLRDKYPNTIIKLRTYCGADKRINWDYTLAVCIYDVQFDRFDLVGFFYDDVFSYDLDFFKYRFRNHYYFDPNGYFYSILDSD